MESVFITIALIAYTLLWLGLVLAIVRGPGWVDANRDQEPTAT